jgi:AcrR family transcriptional regulator
MWQSLPLVSSCHNVGMTPNRRERHKERTRAAIADAGVALFRRHGFEQVTVADIAEAADVAPRTFHRYFPDREELLFAHTPAHQVALAATMDAHPLDPERPLATLSAVLLAMAALHRDRRETARTELELIETTPALRARDLSKQGELEDEVTARLAADLGVAADADPRARLWARVALACFFSAYRSWARGGDDLEAHLRAALDELRRAATA